MSATNENITLTQERAFEMLAFAVSIVEAFAASVISTEEKVRTGGAMALLSTEGKGFQAGKVMGPVADVEAGLFTQNMTNALTKNSAMARHGVILSEAVADITADPPIYGGGIELSDGSYLSFSGFPPEWDQAFCIIVAERFDMITSQRTNSILEASSNPLQARVYLGTARFFLFNHMLTAAMKETRK